jgi:chemotaxis protein MotB
MSDLDLMLTVTKENNAQLNKQLQALSAISSAQAESIKKSIDNINSKDDYLQNLQMAVSRRDSMNLAVLIELKAAMGSLGDEVHIRVQRGLVNVDFSDKLLFSSDSNSYVFGEKAKQAVGRLARVLNDHPEVSCIIEGNTDSVAYPQDILLDNWDLSVKRATAIVRSLQNDYNISPRRLTASGHSEFMTVAPNETPEGRAANRRIRAVIVPPTDQLLRLLERKKGQEDEEVPVVAAKHVQTAVAAPKDSAVAAPKDSAVVATPKDSAVVVTPKDSVVAVKDTAVARVDTVAVKQKDLGVVHVDSAALRVDTAAVHVDSVAIRVDSATVRVDTAAVHVDSVAIPKDSVAPRADTTKRDSTQNITSRSARTEPRVPASIPDPAPSPAAAIVPARATKFS